MTDAVRSQRRADILLFAGIAALAFVVRFHYLRDARSVPLFNALLVDGKSYGDWSDRIVAGDWIGDKIFYQAPLYPYFLALVKLAFGRDLWSIRIVQIALGSLSCGVLFLAGKSFFSRNAGVLAGLILALYPPAIFFDSLIQKANLGLVWIVLLLWLLARAREAPSHARWLLVGLALGLMMLTREETILLVPMLAAWIFLGFRERAKLVRARWIAAFTAGLALVLLPVGARNLAVGGEFVLTTSQAGSNFYIGNGPKATGIYAPLRPGRSDTVYERQDAIELAEAAAGHALTPSEVSRYWFGEAFAFMRAQPKAWMLLMINKLALLMNAYEVPDAEDIYFYERSSTLLRALDAVLHYGIVFPLAIAGLMLTWNARRRLAVLYLMIGALSISVVMFYVFARYRYPLVPIFVLFAAGAIVEGVARARERRWTGVVIALIALSIAAMLSNITIFAKDFQLAESLHNSGVALAKQGDHAKAVEEFRAALTINPSLPETYGKLGDSLRALGKLDDAAGVYRRGLQLRPEDWRNEYRLGVALSPGPKIAEAIEHLKRAVRMKPDSRDAWSALASACMQARDGRGAIDAWRKTMELAPEDKNAATQLAFLLATCPDDELRDGKAALDIAQKLAAKIGTNDIATLDVLAAALAETGRFDEAASVENQALEIATAQHRNELIPSLRTRLELYQQKKPFRQSR